MRIERRRYVVMRRNRTEVWCGLSKHFSFRPITEVKDVSVKTYRSEAQARSGCSSWDRDFEVVPVIEMIATEEALKKWQGRLTETHLKRWCEKIIDQACHPATVQIGEVFLDKVCLCPPSPCRTSG